MDFINSWYCHPAYLSIFWRKWWKLMLNRRATTMASLNSIVLLFTSIGPEFHPKGLTPRSKPESNKITTWMGFFSVSSEKNQNWIKRVLKELLVKTFKPCSLLGSIPMATVKKWWYVTHLSELWHIYICWTCEFQPHRTHISVQESLVFYNSNLVAFT